MECVYRTMLCYHCPVPLKGKGYDFYSSPQLIVGRRVRSNRSGLSISFKTVKLRKGEVYSEIAVVDDSMLLSKMDGQKTGDTTVHFA